MASAGEAVTRDIRIEDQMPEAYAAASRASEVGQTWFKRLTSISLLALVVAAAGALVESPIGGWVSAVAFLFSLLLTALAVYQRSEREWYDGRAAAESIKSITFKYAVGGAPFGLGNNTADTAFTATMHSLLGELQSLGSTIGPPRTAPVLGVLREVRGRTLEKRIATYRTQRIEDQREWYIRRADEHRKTARFWRGVMFAGQAAGVVGAVLKGLDLVDVDLMSIFAAIAASTAAWIAVGDYNETSRAYDFAALEIGNSLEQLGTIRAEEDWAGFVADCEQSMSREHTMWSARRRNH